ncbi:hypothetical protein fugu_001678 [Takifugu bimaculatus]|uniref:Type I cytokine receptor cytokine-binding domain-containing protein n=2 Tax=Takifugu TaxID=31032 RepID=A0A4Z2BNK6_9TELE|nr:hypothetical protein fugu_001678 [Takifugu bimaculatus]
MIRILGLLNLFVLWCLLLETKCATGHIVTQKNISLHWINEFLLQLSSPTCHHYTVSAGDATNWQVSFPYKRSTVMEGNFVNLTLTECNGTTSPPVHISLHYPELVKEVDCYRTSRRDAVCSWIPNTHIQELQFFFVFVNDSEITDEMDFIQNIKMTECQSYNETDGVRTGCDLQLGGTHIFISFRERRNHSSFNTFRKAVASNVRLPALKWNVAKTDYTFNISWETPDIPTDWTITINYTVCGDPKSISVSGSEHIEVPRVPHCPYRLAIQAISLKGKSLWSEYKYFEADPPLLTYAAIFFSLVFTGLATTLLICFRRKREAIFPKIPEPRDLLSSIPDNNFKCTLDSLYSNSKEELCIISLVTEPIYNNIKPLKHPLL